jgi:hypothetical protein
VPRVCSFFGSTNLVRSGESPLGILALDTLQRGRRLAERGRVIFPCKDWPSATAYGGCGLDKGLSPGPRLPPRDRRQGLLARANSGSVNLSTPGSIPVSVEAKHTAIQKQHNVFSALQALHPTRRDLVIAAYIHGESREQLSKRTGIPVNTIKTWIRRSLLEVESILRGKDKDREQVFSRAPQIDRKNQFELGATMG